MQHKKPESLLDLIDDELAKKYSVPQGKRVMKISLAEIICDHLTIATVKGNKKALRLMLTLTKDLKENPQLAPLIIRFSAGAQVVL
jgi:hypothetical protein